MLVWIGADLKTKINRGNGYGSIRPNYHAAVYDEHNPSSDVYAWDAAQTAAHQIGELVQWFHGFVILFTGCAETFNLDFPGTNHPIDAISGGRSTYVMYSGELLKIMQKYGVVCFPCATHDGFLGNMLAKYPKNDSSWGRVHFQPHPILAMEMAHFLTDAVLYSAVMCQIESLTMGPREGRLSLNKFGRIDNVPFMHYWKRSAQNPTGLTTEDVDQEIRWQEIVRGDTNAEEGCVVPHLVHSSRGASLI